MEIDGRPYCANCKQEQLLDVRSGVNRTQLEYGSTWKRFGAMFIDGILMAIPSYAIMFGVLFGTGVMKQGNTEPPTPFILLMYIPFFVLPLTYEALMLSMKDGQTVGKMALKLKVVRPDGSSISTGQAWGRAAMRLVLNCLWIVDYIPVFFTEEKTTLHDMVAGTRVVETW